MRRLTPVGRAQTAADQPRQSARRLGADAAQRLVAAYQAGIPTTQLTAKYGIGKGTVLRILDRSGIARQQQPMTPTECAEAIQLYQSGQSLAAVGSTFGRKHTVIRDVLKRAGIPRRDTHGRSVQTIGGC